MAGGGSRQRSLLRLADQVEDAAAGLHRLRDSLPSSSATRITAVVSVLFAISSLLRQIQTEQATRHYGSSFYRINDDLSLLFRSLKLTLDDVFAMFAQAQEQPARLVWDDLDRRMGCMGGFRLQDRLERYRDFLDTQLNLLGGRVVETPRDLRQDLRYLLEVQESVQRRPHWQNTSGAAGPRPRVPSATIPRIDTPSTSTVVSSEELDHYTNADPPPLIPVPEVPFSPLFPESPTFASHSSHTMSSSQTSYSSDPLSAVPAPLRHWAQNVFDGSHPLTRYRSSTQLDDPSVCHGPVDLSSLSNLQRDGFQRVLQLPFDEDRLWIQLCWRPADHRARILIMTKDHSGLPLHYCTPLTNLKIIRRGSCLQLCRAHRGSGRFSLWAQLNFFFHERMVLFYSTFVAMKRQDQRATPSELVDRFELEDSNGEQELFAGQLQHADMFHALRLFRDRGSGTVRLEASPLRGPRKDVPIWTAFVTKYCYDPDWAHLEGDAVVSFAALRPPPSVFIACYEPPRNQMEKYVLPFTSNEDARMFMETWAGLCRSFGRQI